MSANVGLQNFPFSGKTSHTKNGTIDFFLGLCSDQQLSFFTLLDRTSFLHYNNTKIIKFGWKLFILWVISYRLSFLGFAICHRASKLWKSGKSRKWQSIRNVSWNKKFSTKFDDLDVIIMGNRCSIQQSEESNCWLEQSPENRLYRLFRSFWATLYKIF